MRGVVGVILAVGLLAPAARGQQIAEPAQRFATEALQIARTYPCLDDDVRRGIPLAALLVSMVERAAAEMQNDSTQVAFMRGAASVVLMSHATPSYRPTTDECRVAAASAAITLERHMQWLAERSRPAR